MMTVKNSVNNVNKTLIATAITLACSSMTFAQNTNTVKTISLIKKPISLIKINKEIKVVQDDEDKERVDNSYDEIARLLNQLPGVFSVNKLPNDNSPLITHHSAIASGSLTLLTDNISLGPAPFYLGGIKHITPLFFAEGNSVDSTSIVGFPVVTSSNITSKTPMITDIGNVKLNIGSNNKRGFSFDHGKNDDDFGHRFYAAKQQVDSHREFSNGEQGQFDSNEIFFKIKENKLNTNKNVTQLSLHYKDFTNDESFIGLSENDAKSFPQKRYNGTKLDNINGNELSLGINHQTALYSGEVVTTDIYYNTGDFNYYQTGRINGNNTIDTAQLLSDFETTPNGSLILEKESLDSEFRTLGFKIDIAQSIGKHNLHLGLQYHRESVEQNTSFDTFNLDEQLILNLEEVGDNSGFIDATSKVTGLYLTDTWQHGDWSIDSGIKYVKIKDRREIDKTFFNEITDDTVIYNIKVGYNFSSSLSGFVSTTQGAITQLASESTQLPQLNNQLSAGLLYQLDSGFLSLKVFDNEFENVFTRCDSEESCALITKDKTDIEINAIELSGGATTHFDHWSLPVNFSITSRKSTYIFDDPDVSTSIRLRNNFTFLPKEQLALKVGAQFDQFYFGTRIEYRGKQVVAFDDFSTNSSNIDAATLVDINANYQISKQHLLSFSIENLLDKEYTEQNFYSGKMLGRDRFVSLNYQFNF